MECMKLFLVFAASIFTIWSIHLIVYPMLSPAMASLPGYNGKIAFTSQRDGNSEIYTMMANGQHQTRVTNTLAGSTEPRWSPDGSKIVYHEQIDGSPQIIVIGAGRSSPIQL